MLAHLAPVRPGTGKSVPGHAIAALLSSAGLAWSRDGTKVWRKADDQHKIELRPTVASNTLRPAAPRATTLGGLGINLEHDASSNAAAAAAARPQPIRRLELQAPTVHDAFSGPRGSGTSRQQERPHTERTRPADTAVCGRGAAAVSGWAHAAARAHSPAANMRRVRQTGRSGRAAPQLQQPRMRLRQVLHLCTLNMSWSTMYRMFEMLASVS